MLPSARFSRAQQRCCGEMRNMVVQRQPESSSVITFFPSDANSLPMRLTRWISVPTANMVPAGEFRISFSKPSVDPIPSNHVAERYSHRVAGISAEMLVREKQNLGRLGESPFKSARGIGRCADHAATFSAKSFDRSRG